MQIITLLRYMILQHLRLPVSFVWTILLPTILYIVFQYELNQASFLGAYIVFSSYVYGNSVYLMGCRESGFLKCFVRDRTQLLAFCFSLYLVNTIMVFISLSTFYGFVYLASGINPFQQWLWLLVESPVLYLLSLNLLNVRKESAEVQTILSVLMMLFVVFTFLDHPVVNFVNHINPLYIAGRLTVTEVAPSYLLSTFLLGLTGLTGLWRFNQQPVEGRV